jgi:hypothetical protein
VSSWLELLLLALASMFWPTLVLIVVLALRVPHPVKILAWFLAGGLLTTVSVGIALVFLLEDSSFLSGAHPPGDPVLYITIGLLSLAAAYALNRRIHSRATTPHVETAAAPSKEKKPSLAERAVNRGAVVSFLAGVVLNIVPGTFPFVAMKDIAELDVSDAAKIATIIIFYVIMFTFIEVPIVAYLFAPARTTAATNRFNDWLARNGRRIGVYVLAGVGLYLLVRGVIAAFKS